MAVRIGAVEVELLRDGWDVIPAEVVLAGAPEDQRAAIVAAHSTDGMLPVTHDALLVRSGGRTVLVDAGYGELPEPGAVTGLLPEALAGVGVRPEEVDAVIVSHGHFDHIGGLVQTVAGEVRPVFQRATHYLLRDEHSYWMADDPPMAPHAQLVGPARRSLAPLATRGLLELVAGEREVADGIRLVPAPGHTPGHAVVRIESQGEQAVYLGDTVFHAVNIEHPDWPCVFDADRAAAVRTRRRLLDAAADGGWVIAASHLGSLGRVSRRAGVYAFAGLPSAG